MSYFINSPWETLLLKFYKVLVKFVMMYIVCKMKFVARRFGTLIK